MVTNGLLADRVAIVGVGHSDFGKQLQASEAELACCAISAALQDAGIAPAEVDAMGSYTWEDTPEFEIARNMGFGEIHSFIQIPYGGGAGPAAVGQAALALAMGVANIAVVWRSRKRSDPTKRVWAKTAPVISDHWKWSRPSGLMRPVDEVAMLTRRYFYEHGIGREALADVALALRRYANNNPTAIMYRKPMERDDYLSARMISDPLCLYDNCLETDGAVAVVLARSDRAKDCLKSPVYINAFSQGMSRQHQVMADFHGENPLRSSSWATATNLWRQTDFQPSDVDVAQIYDAFSPLILFSLEAYGFCGVGEAAEYVANDGLAIGGRLPVNTSGGSLSDAYIHGMNLITEGVRQLRGESTSQVPDASVCLVTSCDSTPNGALLLRR
jgi:acetyl-CoA acetyltransferase